MHAYSGIGLMAPEKVHYGEAPQIYEKRSKVPEVAFIKNPSRFKGKIPKPAQIPDAVWTNKPKTEEQVA